MSCRQGTRVAAAVLAVTSLVATPALARRPRLGPALSASSVLRMRAPSPPSAPSVGVMIAQASAPAVGDLPAPKAGPKRAPHRRARLSPITLPETHAPPFYERGWFWPLVGGIAAAIIVTIIVAESVGGDDRMPRGSLGTINVTL